MIDNFCKKLGTAKAAERAGQLYRQLTSAAGGRTHHPSLQHPQVTTPGNHGYTLIGDHGYTLIGDHGYTLIGDHAWLHSNW